MNPCENNKDWTQGPGPRAIFGSSFVFWRVFLKLWNETLRENLNGRNAGIFFGARNTHTVATTRLAPPTLILKLYLWSFTVISCHFFTTKLKFWMFTINFDLGTVPIDVIWLLKMANQLGLVSYFFYESEKTRLAPLGLPALPILPYRPFRGATTQKLMSKKSLQTCFKRL